MSANFQQVVETCRTHGQQNYARWDDALYEQICHGPAKLLWENSRNDASALQSYLRLITEALGCGYITQAVDPRHRDFYLRHIKWRCLLECWLVLEVPTQLPQLPRDKRLPMLAKVWNLGENVLRAQPWLDSYVLRNYATKAPPLAELEKHITQWIEPLFRPAAVAAWKPPFEVAVLEGRTIHNEFLPGEMHLSAASVVCVRDRRLKNVFAGVFLHEHPCQAILYQNDLGQNSNDDKLPVVEFGRSEACINGHSVRLPRLNHFFSSLVCTQGVVLANAVDSQRLWIVRCQ